MAGRCTAETIAKHHGGLTLKLKCSTKCAAPFVLALSNLLPASMKTSPDATSPPLACTTHAGPGKLSVKLWLSPATSVAGAIQTLSAVIGRTTAQRSSNPCHVQYKTAEQAGRPQRRPRQISCFGRGQCDANTQRTSEATRTPLLSLVTSYAGVFNTYDGYDAVARLRAACTRTKPPATGVRSQQVHAGHCHANFSMRREASSDCSLRLHRTGQ